MQSINFCEFTTSSHNHAKVPQTGGMSMFDMKAKKASKLVIGLLVAVIIIALLPGCSTGPASDTSSGQTSSVSPASTDEQSAGSSTGAGDLTINVSELTKTPKFYATEANGTKMEIVALLASDGSVRTAFNTCQVCYSSGRGYYEAEGDELVCQNCGNRFTGDKVGVKSGGCNPVPIMEKDRSEQNGVITISGDLLSQASEIFKNWK
jgi:hypothetical protein